MDNQTVLIIIGLVLILLLINFLHSGIFEVKEIKVRGNKLLTADYIRNFGGLKTGTNIFALDCEQIEKKLSSLPQLKKVIITRKLPNKLEIEVIERKPIAVIPLQESYYVINFEGWILKVINNLSVQDWPVIKGIKISKEEKKVEVTPKLELVINYLQQLSGPVKGKVKEVEVLESGFEVILISGGLVKLGAKFDPGRKARVLSSIYQDLQARDLQVKSIDLRYKKHSFIKTK